MIVHASVQDYFGVVEHKLESEVVVRVHVHASMPDMMYETVYYDVLKDVYHEGLKLPSEFLMYFFKFFV